MIRDIESSPNMGEYQQRDLMPVKQLEKELQQAFIDSGYNSQEKIINLVQEVKQEIA